MVLFFLTVVYCLYSSHLFCASASTSVSPHEGEQLAVEVQPWLKNKVESILHRAQTHEDPSKRAYWQEILAALQHPESCLPKLEQLNNEHAPTKDDQVDTCYIIAQVHEEQAKKTDTPLLDLHGSPRYQHIRKKAQSNTE